jgi:cation diffusion facilitator family transporter
MRLFDGAEVERVGLGAGVMGVSALVNIVVSRRLLLVARRTQSAALRADAYHLLTDVVTAMGVAVGLVVVLLTGLDWLDPLLAILISGVVLHAGWHLMHGSIGVLMDASLPEEELEAVREELAAAPLIDSHHRLRGRRAGRRRYIDVHVQVDGGLTVAEVHRMTDDLELAIADRMPGAEILIHVEPSGHVEDDEPVLSALDQRPSAANGPPPAAEPG